MTAAEETLAGSTAAAEPVVVPAEATQAQPAVAFPVAAVEA